MFLTNIFAENIPGWFPKFTKRLYFFTEVYPKLDFSKFQFNFHTIKFNGQNLL